MARTKKVTNTFDFFNDLKTGNKQADSGKGKKVNTWIDTGCYSYNALISGDLTKGFPGNRVVMLAGEEAVGKTFFAAYGFCKPLVEQGYFIYYIDTENAIDSDFLEGFGLPENSFKVLGEDTDKHKRMRADVNNFAGKDKNNKNYYFFVYFNRSCEILGE